MASVSRRQQLLTRITTFISEGHQHRHIALLCFISADTDGQITSGAALDLAMVTPPDKGDPLTGPKFVAFHGCGGVRARFGKPGSDDEGDVAAGLGSRRKARPLPRGYFLTGLKLAARDLARLMSAELMRRSAISRNLRACGFPPAAAKVSHL